MIYRCEISHRFPGSFQSDVRRVVTELQAAGGKIRIIRIPYEDLAPVFDAVCAELPIPFMPVMFGFPVEFVSPQMAEQDGVPFAKSEVQVIAVRDDDTITATDQAGREEGVLWQGS